MAVDAAARKMARAKWEVAVSRPTDAQSRASSSLEDDDLYWTRVPLDQRARLTWDLSRELYVLAARNGGVFDEDSGTFTTVDGGDLERRLPRAAFRVTRR
ncbi:MAG: hypothetical protein U0235_33030 [Polyangiaceae bacterium]